jgi:hypothetical protein
MKTAREVLLQRHQSATPRLDAIRRDVVADLTAPPDREAARPTTARSLREFLLPLRWHLAGMSALWLLAALLNMDRAPIAPQTAKASSPSPQIVAAALFENRRQLAEMINSPADDAATSTPVPQPFIPRRRSAIQPSSVAV